MESDLDGGTGRNISGVRVGLCGGDLQDVSDEASAVPRFGDMSTPG